MARVFDYIKIALIAYVGVWLINRGLKAAGLSQFATDGKSS